MRSIFIICVILLSFIKVCFSDDYEKGLNAAENGDFKGASELWMPLAKKGDKYAQNGMGMLYYYGHGVKRDNIKAIKWFELSADQGLLKPMYHLGEIYESGGFGIEIDYKKAFKWYLLAAENGFAEAQTTLGIWYEASQGGLKLDYKKAVEWYLLAAKNGDAHGQCRLSYRLQDGMGIKKNKDKSEYWFNQSRKNGFDCQK
jgi:uncharacterized protein